MKSVKRLITWCIFLVWLTACANARSPIATATSVSISYPVIPIPVNVNYDGFSDSGFGFYSAETDFNTESGFSAFIRLLKERGWVECSKRGCNGETAFIATDTDTCQLGIYQFGEGTGVPLLKINMLLMVENGQQIAVELKHCGAVT